MGPLSNLHRKAKELLGLGASADPGQGSTLPDLPPLPASDSVPIELDQSVRYRTARREELHTAVKMILSLPNRPADDMQAAEFLRLSEPRRIDLSLLRVAECRGRLLWALLPVLSPGRTALLLSPPLPRGTVEQQAAGELIEALAEDLRYRDVHLTQALLDPTDKPAHDLFLHHQFEVMAELLYLTVEPRRRITVPALPPGMSWLRYSASTHDLFKQAIAATYEQSLDCPGLNGVRDMEDVVAGHRASGEFDANAWRLLVEAPADPVAPPIPLGVVLLAPLPQTESVELVYLGVPKAARGRKISDLLMRQALLGVGEHGMKRLTLAVDSQNAPALKLYYRHGMTRIGSKLALMRDLRSSSLPTSPEQQ